VDLVAFAEIGPPSVGGVRAVTGVLGRIDVAMVSVVRVASAQVTGAPAEIGGLAVAGLTVDVTKARANPCRLCQT